MKNNVFLISLPKYENKLFHNLYLQELLVVSTKRVQTSKDLDSEYRQRIGTSR